MTAERKTTDRVSRRTLARGTAWAVPAITVAAAAPAMAASPTLDVPCPTDGALLEYYSTNIGTINPTTYNTGDGGRTTNYSVTFGSGWKVPAGMTATDGTAITGFILNYGYCTDNCMDATWPSPDGSVTGVNHHGTSFTGKVTVTAPALCEPRSASGGGSTSITFNTTLPYEALYCTDSGARIAGVSMPVTVFYLDGIEIDSRRSQGCCAYLNLTYNNTGCADGTFGYDITAISFTTTRQYS